MEHFNKTILTTWIDEETFNLYYISVDDYGDIFLTERKPTPLKDNEYGK